MEGKNGFTSFEGFGPGVEAPGFKPLTNDSKDKFGLRTVSVNSFDQNPPYILKLATNYTAGSQCLVASSSSDSTVKLHALDTNNGSLGYISELKGHQKAISGMGFIPGHEKLVYTASEDGTVVVWDTSSAKIARSFSAPNRKPFYSATCNQKALAAGTGSDIYLWDLESGKPFRSLEEYHTEEVTDLKFHPNHPNMLFSSGGDGMISQFDLSQMDEDEVLEGCINSSQPINSFDFFGPKLQYIQLINTMEEVTLFDIDTANKLIEFPDLRKSLSAVAGEEINYLIKCRYDIKSDRLYVCSGTNNGGLLISHLAKENIKNNLALYNEIGHNDIIRDLLFIDELQIVVSGGEDSKICVWAQGASKLPKSQSHAKAPASSRQSRQFNNRSNPYGGWRGRGRGSGRGRNQGRCQARGRGRGYSRGRGRGRGGRQMQRGRGRR
ncbi:hypothetical protein AAMO2058_000512300 [Amorphochlora amoebiformis]